jgi:branched-chain amino acid transport system substrate-binding protein
MTIPNAPNHIAVSLSLVLTLLYSLFSSAALQAREIVVAQSLDLSGQTNLGKDFSNGLRTYFDGVNAKGGVRGRQITFVQLDDNGRAEDTAANITRLLREYNVDVFVGPTTSASLVAAARVLRGREVALLGAPVGASLGGDSGARILQVRGSYRDEARLMTNHLSQTLNAKRIAIVRGDGDESAVAAEAFRTEAKARTLPIALDATVGEFLARNRENDGLEAIILCGDAIAIAPAVAHARKTAKGANLFGFSMIDHTTLIELAKQSAVGIMISQAMPMANKNVHAFQREHRELMKRFRDEEPNLHTLEGYVIARVLTNAFASINGEPTPARTHAALRKEAGLDLGAIAVSANDPTSGKRFVNLTAISTKGKLID